ncbi:MAG: PUA domain-containing protein [Candidatus Bathyarchaeia archaeon]
MNLDSAPRLRKLRVLRRRDARRLVEEAAPLLGDAVPATVQQAELDDGTVIYLLDGAPLLARAGGVLFPTLTSPCLEGLPSVVVDMGAVPYVCNGADVMAPGIVEVRGDFEEGGLVVVRDVRHGKALSVGTALTSSDEMRAAEGGKVVRNLHYVGDRLWRACS